MQSVQKVGGIESGEKEIPTFLHFNNKSLVLKVLRTKLW
jgi:hypothetical protein